MLFKILPKTRLESSLKTLHPKITYMTRPPRSRDFLLRAPGKMLKRLLRLTKMNRPLQVQSQRPVHKNERGRRAGKRDRARAKRHKLAKQEILLAPQ